MNWDKIRREFFEYFNCNTGLIDKVIVFNWFKEKLTPITRTSSQNRALHLYMTKWANSLNNAGYTFTNSLGFEIPFTMELIKESIWKPTQKELFNIKSTKQLTTKMINEMIDVFSMNFGKRGMYVDFPNWQTFLNEIDSNK